MASKSEKFRKIRKSIKNQIDDVKTRERLTTELERAEYIDELISVKRKFLDQAKEKGVENAEFQFYGQPGTSKKDIVFITYTITNTTQGKTENVVLFLKKLMAAEGAADYFDMSTLRVIGENGEPGETVKISIFRNNHDFDTISSDPIDPVATGGDDDEGDEDGFF